MMVFEAKLEKVVPFDTESSHYLLQRQNATNLLAFNLLMMWEESFQRQKGSKNKKKVLKLQTD